MPIFKPKNIKSITINKKASTTLDGKHGEFMNHFEQLEKEKIPQLKRERKRMLLLLEKERAKGGATASIEKVLDLQDKIAELSKEIRALREKKTDYFLDNSKYIFDYFENKKNISNVAEPVAEGSGSSSSTKTKNNILHSFFKLDKDKEKTGEGGQVAGEMEYKNQTLYAQYLSNIDDCFLDIKCFVRPTDVCQGCFKGELIPMDDEGVLICNVCSRNIQYLIENDKPSYKEPPKEVCFYAYKKINHFKEIIAQFQGKETTQIPDEVIELLKAQIKKERIDLSNLTYYKTKELLKKLGYNKYYEHINFIKNKLGIKPPMISQELEETLCNFFMEIQYPYAKHCPDYRVNFLHYYYVLFKLFELLGETHYLADIPMLKDREKLIDQDNIWKKICHDLDWEFIATV